MVSHQHLKLQLNKNWKFSLLLYSDITQLRLR